jgi:hypothetical protein
LDGESLIHVENEVVSPDNWCTSIVDSTDNDFNKRKRQLEHTLGLSDSFDINASNGNDCENDDENNDDDEEYCYPDTNHALVHLPEGELPPWTGAEDVPPSTTLLLQLDQVLTQRVLGYHVDWLQDRALTSGSGQWIYGLLSRLEKPVAQATVAVIRQLYRRCCALRCTLAAQHSFGEASSSFEADLAALNILISISGAYFGQGEAYVAFNHQNHSRMTEAGEGEEEEGFDEEEEEYLSAMDRVVNEEGGADEDGVEVEGGGGKKARVDRVEGEERDVAMDVSVVAITPRSVLVVSSEREEGEEVEEEEEEEEEGGV